MATAKLDMDTLVSLCRRRGFIFQSSEIYGGINGFWDYGPLGVELKKNIKDAWWQDMVRNPPPGPDGQEITMVGLDCSIIMNPKVWEASGHVAGFTDPMLECKKCQGKFRADKVYFFRPTGAGPTGQIRPEEILRIWTIEAESVKEAEDGFADSVKQFAKKNNLAAFKGTIRVVDSVPPGLRELRGEGQSSILFKPPLRADDAYFQKDPGYYAASPCPRCGAVGSLTEPRKFNMMFKSHAGAMEDTASEVYLRPETAQGIFANYRNVIDSTRLKLPFGIAQVGKAFRNEINPRNFTFRSREFEQMEIEFFCHPAESRRWYEYWRDVRKKWYSTLGIRSENLRPREQGKDELAHYSVGTTDIEYMFPFSDEPQELEGVAHRGDFDLSAHMKHSGKDLTYFDEDAWNRDAAGRKTNSFKEWLKANPSKEEIEKYQFVPHVIEPSAGADRFTLAVLCEAYTEDQMADAKGNLEKRVLMKFHPRLAPVKAAVLPLVKKDGMPERAEALYRELKKHYKVEYDDAGAVGRRYRRQDEIGTPFCITIDGTTLQDDTVTIRERDSGQQRRVPINGVLAEIRKALE